MVKQSFINDYGIDKILEPFMESIQQLESVSDFAVVAGLERYL